MLSTLLSPNVVEEKRTQKLNTVFISKLTVKEIPHIIVQQAHLVVTKDPHILPAV